MAVISRIFELTTNGNCEIVNLTDSITRLVRTSGLKDGLVNIFVPSSNIGFCIVETEAGKVEEFINAFKNLAKFYTNEKIDAQLKSCIFNSSLTLPFCKANLLLDTWQQIILIDFGSETKFNKVNVQIIGE